VRPTRGADTVATFKDVSRVLAGFDDGRAGEGVGAGQASLIGLRLAHRRGWTAPGEQGRTDGEVAPDADDDAPGLSPGLPSSTDSPANEPDEHPADGTATKGGTA
jgi:NADH-quinone oxidoreductase subunit E